MIDYNTRKVDAFLEYIEDTSKYFYDVLTLDGLYQMPYMHRWTPAYKNKQLAKLYRFQEWYLENPTPITMLTLTTYQRGVDLEDQMALLIDSYTKIMKAIRRIHKDNHSHTERTFDGSTGRASRKRVMAEDSKLDYIRILEPHKSGYAHLHILLLTSFTEVQTQKIRRLWTDKYCAGNAHGVDFSTTSQGRLTHPIAYIMKYLTKTLSVMSSGYGEIMHGATVYALEHDKNARGVRTISVSRNLSKIMRIPDDRTPDEIEDSEMYQMPSMIVANHPDRDRFEKLNGHDFIPELQKKYKDLMEVRF